MTAGNTLDQISLRIASETGPVHRVQFTTFTSPGQFRLPAAPATLDTLIFERVARQESDSAVQVSNALLEIKQMRGTVVLRGLAFELKSPAAVLLSGFEVGKANRHLVIDSCIISADSNASTFLSWLGNAGSRVEILRSYFVFRAGTPAQTRMLISAHQIQLANNLLNHQGLVQATLQANAQNGGKFEGRANTINRTQFHLATEGFPQPAYDFLLNHIAYPPAVDAMGGATPHVLYSTGFAKESQARLNLMQSGWTFDNPVSDIRTFENGGNKIREPIGVPSADELWKWHPPANDSDVGHLNGNFRRVRRYNVWPGDTSHTDRWNYNQATVYFRPAPFPRNLSWDSVSNVPVPSSLSPRLRILAPGTGALHFGPFQVRSIHLFTKSDLGLPRLLSADTSFAFHPQRITGSRNANPFPFPNDSLSARYFFFAFEGNTPKGLNITPDRETSSLGAHDTLVYRKVDSTGFTLVMEVASGSIRFPPDIRDLSRNLKITTSADLSDSMVVSTLEHQDFKPWLSDQVHWWRSPDNFFQARQGPPGRYQVTLPAIRACTLFLVEKLNVKRADTTLFALGQGNEVVATSTGGFQLLIDSTKITHPRYGLPGTAYGFRFPGRGDGDLLTLSLKAGKDQVLFRMPRGVDTLAVELPDKPDSNQVFKVQVSKADSGVRFFTAIPYNVEANRPFPGVLHPAFLTGLHSSTPGLIRIAGFDNTLLDKGVGTADRLPPNVQLLGGWGLYTFNLTLAGPFQAQVPISSRFTDSSQVAAYAWDGTRWRHLANSRFAAPTEFVANGLLANDAAFIVLERLRPPQLYVDTSTKFVDRKVMLTTGFTDPDHRPIKSLTLNVRHVGESGVADTISMGPEKIGETLQIDLAGKNGFFKFGIQFFTDEAGKVPYGGIHYSPIDSFGWTAREIRIEKAIKHKNRLHLVGVPYRSLFSRSLTKTAEPDSNSFLRTSIYRIKYVAGLPTWDKTGIDDDSVWQPGTAFLLQSSAQYTQRVDSLTTFLKGTPFTIVPDSAGWQLISVPFPMAFRVDNVISTRGNSHRFFSLDTMPVRVGDSVVYSWPVVDSLLPFKGYAYHFRTGETLTFDPWNASVKPPAKRAAEGPASVEIAFRSGPFRRSMQLVQGSKDWDIPALTPPGSGPIMNVGGRGGYFRKGVNSLREIDEPVTLRTPVPGKAYLEVAEVSPSTWVRLLDPSGGRVWNPVAEDIPVPVGGGEYRLLVGERAFVEDRVRNFQAGIPATMSLAQNFPNPFRAVTRIALDWPALGSGGVRREARLEIFDTRGRRIKVHPLGEVQAGRQVVAVDASGWDPGLYTYRLTVQTGASKIHLQKKMLVTP